MSIGIISLPIVDSCAWNAAGNPLIYKLRRFDDGFDQINNSGGFIQVQINGTDRTGFYEVGDSMWVNSTNAVYSLGGTITASAFSGGNTLITINKAYISAAPGGVVVNNSKRTDYKAFVDIFDSVTNLSLLTGLPNTSMSHILAFSPRSSGEILADVSSILKSVLNPDWELPASDNEPEIGTHQGFYIQYREYYDGSNQGSITAEPTLIFAVHGARQIHSPHGSNMRGYFLSDSTSQFLQRFQPSTAFKKMVAWRDWPFTVSFIWPLAQPNVYWFVIQYASNGGQTGATVVDALDSDSGNDINKIHRLKLPEIEDDAVRMTIFFRDSLPIDYLLTDPGFASSFGSDWDNVAGVDQAWNGSVPGTVRVNLSSGQSSRYLRNDPLVNGPMSIGDTITSILLEINIPVGMTVTAAVLGWNGSTRETLGSAVIVGNGILLPHPLTVVSPCTQANTHVEIRLTCSASVGTQTAIIGQIDFIAENVVNDISETLDIEIRDACGFNSDYEGLLAEKNPIHLFWKNSLGGDSWWNFEKVHEYVYNYSDGKKAKRIVLFATGLHPVQWEALNELNTIGEVYRVNITELTSSINSTSKRIGAQVYMVSQDGETKTGVIVIPASETQKARASKHTFSVEIELPEVFGME